MNNYLEIMMRKKIKSSMIKVAKIVLHETVHPALQAHKRYISHLSKKPIFSELSHPIREKLPLEHQVALDDINIQGEQYVGEVKSATSELNAIDERIRELEANRSTAGLSRQQIESIDRDIRESRTRKAEISKDLARSANELRQQVRAVELEHGTHEHKINPKVDASRFIEIDERGRFKVDRTKLTEYARSHSELDLKDLRERMKEYRGDVLTNYYMADKLILDVTDKTIISKLKRFKAYVSSRPWSIAFKAGVGGICVYQAWATVATQAGANPRANLATAAIANDLSSQLEEVKPTLVILEQTTSAQIENIKKLLGQSLIKDNAQEAISSLQELNRSIEDLVSYVKGKDIDESMVSAVSSKARMIRAKAAGAAEQCNELLENLNSIITRYDEKIQKTSDEDKKQKLSSNKGFFVNQKRDLENHIKAIVSTKNSIDQAIGLASEK